MSSSKSLLARSLALVMLASLAAACGRGEDQAAKQPAAPAATGAGKPASGAASAPSPAEAAAAKAQDEGMANAVAVGKTSAAVDLKYDMSAKPGVGQPFEIQLAFLPRMAADSLEVEASGMAGLVLAGGSTAKFENVVAGERYVAKMLVQVDQPGLYYIGITAKMTSKVQSEARTFSVPVVVGAPLPEEKPAAAAAAPGATVKSMKAVETATPAEQKK